MTRAAAGRALHSCSPHRKQGERKGRDIPVSPSTPQCPGDVLNKEPEVQGAWVCSLESVSLPLTQLREKGAEGVGHRVEVGGGGGCCIGF